jgi:hypothetical protein
LMVAHQAERLLQAGEKAVGHFKFGFGHRTLRRLE